MVPFPVMASRFYNNFSLNAPAWSLFWEYVANLFYALFLHRLGRRYLMMLVVPAAAGIGWVIYTALGAGTAPAPRVRKFCVFSGKISYPLYMTHYWLIWIFADYLGLHRPAGVRLFVIVLGVVVLQVILAYVVMVVFDGPVRRALSRRTRVVRG